MKTKNLVLTGLFIAFGLVLPMAFHSIANAGSIFLPMHIPVLLCGLILGWKYGLVCGILTPFISSILTGMPPAAVLPGMVVELGVYGLTSGVLAVLLKSKMRVFRIYMPLIGAMLLGRLAAGVVKALIFSAGTYTMKAWIASSFVTALPGIIIQLVFIPVIIITLQKARVIEPIVVS